MPIYDFFCPVCVIKIEIISQPDAPPPVCNHCGVVMDKQPNYPAMVKVKGMGGYPSRRKFYKGSAPYCGGAKEFHPTEHKVFNPKED